MNDGYISPAAFVPNKETGVLEMPVDTNQAFMIVYHIDEVTEAPKTEHIPEIPKQPVLVSQPSKIITPIVKPPASIEEYKASNPTNDDDAWAALRNKVSVPTPTQQPYQNISHQNCQSKKGKKGHR